MTLYKGKLIVGGLFDSIGGQAIKNIAQWNGNSWSALGDGNFDDGVLGFETVYAFCTGGGRLYAAGDFYGNISAWNDTSWTTSVGNGEACLPRSIAENNGILYVGGECPTTNEVANTTYIAEWDGANWGAVDSGLGDYVLSLYLGNGILYAGTESIYGNIYSYAIPGSAVPDTNCKAFYRSVADTTPHVWDMMNECTGVAPISYIWSWGDSSANSLIPDPSHTYTTPGNYKVCVSITDSLSCTSSYCDSSTYYYKTESTITVKVIDSVTTGINSITETTKTAIYPNPGNGIVNIALQNITEPCQVDVYNLLGKKIYHAYLNSANTTIDIGRLASGAYLYRISKQDGTLVSSGKYILE